MISLFKPGGTYKWSLMKGYEKVSDEIVENLLTQAFAVWTQYLNITITKSHKNDPYADIKIGFYSKNHENHEECQHKFDGPGGKFAHSTYPAMAESTYMHFDNDEQWLFDDKITLTNYFTKRPVFKAIAIHEVGHILGLTHNDVTNSVMNTVYSRLITRPTKKDIETLQRQLQVKPNAPQIKEELKVISWGKTYYQELTILAIILVLLVIVYMLLPKKAIQRHAADKFKQFQRFFHNYTQR